MEGGGMMKRGVMMEGEGGGMVQEREGDGVVEGGRESTGAHSPGLVVAFIRRRPWGVVVSEGACHSWGIVVIRGWGIVLVCWWGVVRMRLRDVLVVALVARRGFTVVVGVRVGGGSLLPVRACRSWVRGSTVVVVVTVKPWWWCCRRAVVVVVTVKQWWWWFSSSGGGGGRR